MEMGRQITGWFETKIPCPGSFIIWGALRISACFRRCDQIRSTGSILPLTTHELESRTDRPELVGSAQQRYELEATEYTTSASER